MLKVSEAQYAALEAFFGDDFAERMTNVLFQSFPEECKAQGRLRVLVFVRSSIDRARSLGARLESDLRRHVVTEFVVGVAAMRDILDVERKRLLARDGVVSPTLLIFLAHQAMFARFPDDEPPPPSDPVYEAVV